MVRVSGLGVSEWRKQAIQRDRERGRGAYMHACVPHACAAARLSMAAGGVSPSHRADFEDNNGRIPMASNAQGRREPTRPRPQEQEKKFLPPLISPLANPAAFARPSRALPTNTSLANTSLSRKTKKKRLPAACQDAKNSRRVPAIDVRLMHHQQSHHEHVTLRSRPVERSGRTA